MTTAGWIFMVGSLSVVIALNVFCFSRVLRNPKAADRMQSPLEIDTGDTTE